MISANWPAPAKINLFLHIIGRRPDGYHELQTAFQFLAYGDELAFTVTDDGAITRNGGDYDVEPADDLVIRAARALQQAAKIAAGAEINIKKQIPMGGGLGGGSSDAATVLVALNHLWQAQLNIDELAEIGLNLGADVPVFIRGHAAWAEGVGEKLVPVEPPQDWFLLLHPGCHVGTATVFNAPDLTRNTPPITIRNFLAGAGHNDCESVVYKAFPAVAEAAGWLGEYAQVRMTGTGACLFASFKEQAEAETVLKKLPGKWNGFVTQGLNISPLQRRLQQEIDNS